MIAVRIYRVDFEAEEKIDHFDALLDPAERARRDRLVFERDRREFTCCRGTLRLRLGHELGIDPRAVAFREGPYGKPHLHDDAVSFNVSHSGTIGLIALTDASPIGVDIEQERPLEDISALARRYFSPREQNALRALPTALRGPGFFRCWSRKEAFIKAIGMGLSFPLERFDMTLDPRQPARLLDVRDPQHGATPWRVHHLEIEPGYSAALVTSGPASIRLMTP